MLEVEQHREGNAGSQVPASQDQGGGKQKQPDHHAVILEVHMIHEQEAGIGEGEQQQAIAFRRG